MHRPLPVEEYHYATSPLTALVVTFSLKHSYTQFAEAREFTSEESVAAMCLNLAKFLVQFQEARIFTTFTGLYSVLYSKLARYVQPN